MKSRPQSLTYRLTAAISFVLLACIAAVSYLCYYVAADLMESGVKRNLRQMAVMTASDLDRWILAQESTLKAVASIPAYLAADQQQRNRLRPVIRQSLNGILRSSPVFIAGVTLFDANFKLSLSTFDEFHHDRKIVLHADLIKGPNRKLFNLQFFPKDAERIFNLYRPVFSGKQLLGLVSVSYRNSMLDHMLMRSALLVEQQLPLHAFLVDDKGHMIRHLSLDVNGLVKSHRCEPPVQDESPFCQFPPWTASEGQQILQASQPMAFSRWSVHFSQPREAVVASLQWKMLPWLLGIFSFIVAIVYLSYLVIKRTIRPLNNLTIRVQHTLEDGDHPTVLSGQADEVQMLAQAFDGLSDRLDRSFKDLCLARDHAESANRIKSEFLAHMSHEIRTPLTAIVGFAELMQENSLTGENFDTESISIIERNARHLLALVNDILDFSKIEAQELHLQQEMFDPIVIARDVLDSLLAKAKDKNLTLSLLCEYLPTAFSILGDPLRFKQVLINLVDNGIKYTEKGQVQICLSFAPQSSDQGRLTCMINDTGIGMSADELHKLFQPFSQLSGRARNTPGTGLGLAICRRLAQQMDGNITCESTPGAGSRFTWRMNVSFQAGNAAVVSMNPGRGPYACDQERAGRARILIAEDAQDSQQLLRWILEKAGATVTIVQNGREAIEQVTVHASDDAFDLVLMDISMPVVNGYEATAELRKRGFTRPILALTAHATAGDRDRCESAGCSDYLTKPIDRQTLLSKISSHVPDFRTLP